MSRKFKEIKVVFVGDKPSSKNIDRNIAFVGTQSYKRLIKWIVALKVKHYHLFNSNDQRDLDYIKLYESWGYKVIALGLAADGRLAKESIPHYRMPHPSGLNRQNNNDNYIKAKLEECRKYIYET